jgi:hypothetical protein
MGKKVVSDRDRAFNVLVGRVAEAGSLRAIGDLIDAADYAGAAKEMLNAYCEWGDVSNIIVAAVARDPQKALETLRIFAASALNDESFPRWDHDTVGSANYPACLILGLFEAAIYLQTLKSDSSGYLYEYFDPIYQGISTLMVEVLSTLKARTATSAWLNDNGRMYRQRLSERIKHYLRKTTAGNRWHHDLVRQIAGKMAEEGELICHSELAALVFDNIFYAIVENNQFFTPAQKIWALARPYLGEEKDK